MRTILLFLLGCLLNTAISAQKLYIKTFGNKNDTPLIYLHGGPGYNAVGFEVIAAQKLSESGFFVIVYDRRGEGRSEDPKAKYTFKQTFDDLNLIYKKLKIKKAVLIGHSFGGVVGSLYAAQYPEKVNALLLMGAPVSLQASFRHIISRSRTIYLEKGDYVNLSYLDMLEKMDTASVQYSSYCFVHAMQNGFYTPKNPSDEAKKLYETLKSDSLMVRYASKMTTEPTLGFWKNEHYTTINLSATLKSLKASQMGLYAIYGKDDGLYSAQQISELGDIVGKDRIVYYENCSHNPFFDKQTDFINQMKDWFLKK